MEYGANWNRRLNGTVIERPLDRPPSGPPEFVERVISYSRYEWLPPYQLCGPGMSRFKLAFDCYVAPDGTRRFTLVEPSQADVRADPLLQRIMKVKDLAYMASYGGFQLMRDRGEIESDLLLDPDQSRIFSQYLARRRESLHPRKNLQRNLRVAAAGRPDRNTKTILPEDLVVDASDEICGRRTEPLGREGVARAQADGIERPTPRQVFSFGLTAAAERRPHYLDSVTDVAAVVRMSLFAPTKSRSAVTEDQLQYVAACVRNSLEERWHSDAKLKLWIEDRKADLIRRISKSRGRMSREHVNKVLFELGWRSLQIVGKCIDVQMRAFRDALPVPLTDIEDYYFSQVFLANPALGGLPLLLLRAQYDDLSAAFTQVWNSPGDRDAVAVLHRVLSYYAEILRNRRGADTTYKHRTRIEKHEKNIGRIAREEGYHVEPDRASTEDTEDEENIRLKVVEKSSPELEKAVVSENPAENVFSEIAKRLAEARGLKCEFEDHDWWARLKHSDDSEICFELCCPDVHFDEMITVPRAEFEAVAMQVGQDE